jgi:hypothetical protein
LAWILALIVVQLNRWALRILAVRFGRWGEPVAIVGYGPQGKSVVDFFLQNSRFGIRPAIIVDGFGSPDPTPSSLPRVHITHDGKCSGGEGLAGIQTAVLLTSEIPVPIQEALLDRQRFGFKRLILVSNLEWVGSMGVTPYDLEGLLGLEVRQNLLDPWQQFTKRHMETTFSDDLRRYLALLWHWAWLLILAAVLAASASYVVSRRTIPVYQTSTLLLVSQGQSARTDDYSSVITAERLASTYTQLIVSQPVLEGVSERLGLDLGPTSPPAWSARPRCAIRS